MRWKGMPSTCFLANHERAVDHLLHRGEHVVLGHEGHFDIQLVELAGRAVRARVLVAEAGAIWK